MSSEQLYILKQVGQSCISVSAGTDSIATPPNFMSRECVAISVTRGSWKRGCGLDIPGFPKLPTLIDGVGADLLHKHVSLSWNFFSCSLLISHSFHNFFWNTNETTTRISLLKGRTRWQDVPPITIRIVLFCASTSVPTLITTLACLKCSLFRYVKNMCHLPPDLFLQMRTPVLEWGDSSDRFLKWNQFLNKDFQVVAVLYSNLPTKGYSL